jgi:hypothetical protein
MMTVVAGGMFGLTVLFAPQYGVISKVIHNLRMTLQVLREDLLAMLYRVEELGGKKPLTHVDAQTALARSTSGILIFRSRTLAGMLPGNSSGRIGCGRPIS